MKKITLITLSIIFTITVQAQLFNIGGIDVGYLYVGPKLGGNVSFNSVDLGTTIDKTSNSGYQIGGVGKFGITKKLAIQPELVYSSKGFGATTSFATSKANYKYLGLPIVAKYAFAAIAGIDVYGSGGFYTDILTGVKSKTVFTDGTEESHSPPDLTAYKKVDFGFNFGAGANIPFKTGDQLNIDLRFSFGVTDVDNQDLYTSSKNTSIQLSAIYLVDLTKWVNFKGKSTLEEDAYEQESVPAGGSKVENEEN